MHQEDTLSIQLKAGAPHHKWSSLLIKKCSFPSPQLYTLVKGFKKCIPNDSLSKMLYWKVMRKREKGKSEVFQVQCS